MLVRRITYIASAVAVAALVVSGCSDPNAGSAPQTAAKSGAAIPAKPSAPVSLHILDVAGNQKLTRTMIDDFVKAHSDVISSVTWETGGAPDLVGNIKPQVASGKLSVDLVMTGTDGLSAGIGQNLWIPLVTDYGARLSNQKNYLAPAAKMQALAEGYGVETVYYPSGPLLQYNPSVVKTVPTTPAALLAWAKANPGKFGYARPANSGPGRTFLMGLPYILGDKDPKDPMNGWAKTWAYLKDLGSTINNYPTGTGQVISNMADGTWDLLLQNMLTPDQNAKAYDSGYFYPGPAITGATLDKAPKASQDVIAKYGRTWYDPLIAKMPKATPLTPALMVKAFDIWDRTIGSGKFKA